LPKTKKTANSGGKASQGDGNNSGSEVGTCPKRGDSDNSQRKRNNATKVGKNASQESQETRFLRATLGRTTGTDKDDHLGYDSDAASSTDGLPDLFESTDEENGVPSHRIAKPKSVFKKPEPPLSTVQPDGNEQWEVGNQCDDTEAGELQKLAASILMKVLYGARMCRFDLLRPTCRLAQKVTKWDRACDKRLHRLMSYINSTLSHKLYSWVGDEPKDISVGQYADADLAGCPETQRATSGAHLILEGPHTRFVLSASSARQTVCSLSTPEAEIIAAVKALKSSLIPAMDLWEVLLPSTKIIFHEDNTAMIQICKTGKNPTMRHLPRVHRLAIAFLFENLGPTSFHGIKLQYTNSDQMCADIYTKA